MDLNSVFNTPDHTDEFIESDIESNKIWSGLAYLGGGFLFFLPLIINNNSPFGKFHANQALSFFIFDAIVGIATGVILRRIPIIGSIISAVISLAGIALMLFGLINAIQGKAKSLPLIGELFKIIK